METSLDLGIKRRRELGSPLYPSLEKKGGVRVVGGVKLLTTRRKEGTTLLRWEEGRALRHGGVTNIHVACVAIVESQTFLFTNKKQFFNITFNLKLSVIWHCSLKSSAVLCAFEQWKCLKKWQLRHLILSYVDVSICTYSWIVTLSYIKYKIHFCMSLKSSDKTKVQFTSLACALNQPFLMS